MSIDINLLPLKESYETLQLLCSDVYKGLSVVFPCLPAWIASRRAEGLIRACKQVHNKLEASGIQPEQIRECALKIGIPLLEAASLEDNTELRDIWASLLANALNPNFCEEIRTGYIDIAKNLSPLDVRILEFMRSANEFTMPKTYEERTYITNLLYAKIDDIEVSLDNLKRLQLVDNIRSASEVQNEAPPLEDELEGSSITLNVPLMSEGAYRFTALGRAFMNACSV